MSGKLAVQGGTSIRGDRKFAAWPVYGAAEREALNRVLDSNVWGVGGREQERFERDFAAYSGCEYAVTMCNGSVTLRNALLACGVEAGSEVIVPPYTFLATVTSVLEANCVPVFADLDPETYCMDPAKIEAVITPRTRVIIPVHIGGNAAEMDSIMAIARRHELLVIEDAAHAVGAEYKGRRLGSIGDIGSFSFQSSKNLCSGEGGAITSRSKELYLNCWSIHNCGRDQEGAWYEHNRLGGNYRLGEFQAAILNEQFKKVDAEMAVRARNAEYLAAGLADLPGVRPLGITPGLTRHAWHLFIVRYDESCYGGASRAAWLKALAAEGIPICAGYDTPQYRHRFMLEKAFISFDGWKKHRADLDYSRTDCPVCEQASGREGAWMAQNVLLGSERDMDDIIAAFRKVYECREELRRI